MIRHLLIGSAATAALLLTGCASVVNGHNQSVSVTTKSKGDEVSGAKCSLSNDKGVWYVTTPGSVAVHRSYGELTVNCALTGLLNGIAAAKSSTTAAVFGNILVGGVIGAGIDVATGAAYGSAWSTHTSDKSLPTDPKERALANCKRVGGEDCQLYVVDNEVIFQAAASMPPQGSTLPIE